MKKVIRIIYSILLIFSIHAEISISILRFKTSRSKARVKESNYCDEIEKLAEEYIKLGFPKYKNFHLKIATSELFIDQIEFNIETGVFRFLFMEEGSKEFEEFQKVSKFFHDNAIPWKYNTAIMNFCNAKFQQKFKNENSYLPTASIIASFGIYRHKTMIKYLEKAIQDGIKNQEYILGEIPLTEKQKLEKIKERMNKMKENVPFSIHWMKVSNPVYIFKGGEKRLLDEDSFEIPSSSYLEKEMAFIQKLKANLAQSCAISFFLPVDCSNYIRVCATDANLKMNVDFYTKENFYFCYNRYALVCVTDDEFAEILLTSNEGSKENRVIPDSLKLKTIHISFNNDLYFLDQQKLVFSTFQTNMVKNINLQRIILDNLNHRFQNDFTLISKDGYLTIFDCMNIVTLIMGMKDDNLDKRQFTGIDDIDFILKGMNNEQSLKFDKVEKSTILASAGISIFQLWKLFIYDGITSDIEFQHGVNFDEGILHQIKDYFFDESFYYNIIASSFHDIQSQDSAMKLLVLDQDKISKISKRVISNLKELVENYKEGILDIRKIINDVNKDIGYFEELPSNEKSAKLIEGFSLLTMESLQDLSLIQPDFGVALNIYKKFRLKNAITLEFSPDSIFLTKHYTMNSNIGNDCQKVMTKIMFVLSKSLLSFYKNYDDSVYTSKNPEENFSQKHLNAFSNLGFYFGYFKIDVFWKCRFKGSNFEDNFFYKEFEKNGYYMDRGLPTMKLLTEPEIPELDEKYSKNKGVSDYIFNMLILKKFSIVTNLLNLKFAKNSVDLYKNFLLAEKNYLSHIKGYEIGNKKKIIGVLSETFSYIMMTTLITSEINQAILNEMSSSENSI